MRSFYKSDLGGRGADNGMTLVLQNEESYRTEILRQLSENDFYTLLFGEKLCLRLLRLLSFLLTD